LFCAFIVFAVMASGLSQTHPHLPTYLVAAAVASPVLLPAIVIVVLWRSPTRNTGSRMPQGIRIGGLSLGLVLVGLGLERQLNDSGDWFIYPVFWLTGLCLFVFCLLAKRKPYTSDPEGLR